MKINSEFLETFFKGIQILDNSERRCSFQCNQLRDKGEGYMYCNLFGEELDGGHRWNCNVVRCEKCVKAFSL